MIANSDVLFFTLPKFITIVLIDSLLFICFPLFRLVCRLGDDAAAGDPSGEILPRSDKPEKLLLKLKDGSWNSELAKFGKPHWQHIHEQLEFSRAS